MDYVQSFFKNFYYFKKTGVLVTIFFALILFLLAGGNTVGGGTMGYFNASIITIIPFLILYGIPINIFVKLRKGHLNKNLGKRLTLEVSNLKFKDYKSWNDKNKEHLDFVRNYVIQRLTEIHEKSLSEIKDLDEKIIKLHGEKDKKVTELKGKIDKEKTTVQSLIERHPFLKTLKDIQNRTSK